MSKLPKTRLHALTKLLLAGAVLFLAVAASGGFAGWLVTWHDALARKALEHAKGAQAASGDLERAVDHFARALELNPLSRRDRSGLEVALEPAIGRLGTASVAALAPAATLPRETIAAALARHGDPLEAARLRATMGPTRPEEIEVMSGQMLRDSGMALAAAGRCALALPLLEAAVGRIGEDPSFALHYAHCLTEGGQASRALPVLAYVYQRDPTSKWLHFSVAEAHLALGNIHEADMVTRVLTERAPDFYFGWRLRGDLLRAAGRKREAAECYRRALAIHPEYLWLKALLGAVENEAAREDAAGAAATRPPSSS